MVSWKTFPERLEENDISWKIYQNDISIDGGYSAEEDAWMANFGDNPIEYFTQYNVKLSSRYISCLQKQSVTLPAELAELENKVRASSAKDKESADLKKKLESKKAALAKIKEEVAIYTTEKYNQLSQHEKIFTKKRLVTTKKTPIFASLHRYSTTTKIQNVK